MSTTAAMREAQAAQQSMFTGCGICGGAFCKHGRCRVCTECDLCDVDEKPAARAERHGDKSEQERIHAKSEQWHADRAQALAELGATKCACGAHKRDHQSFCKHCYTSLPSEVRAGLYLAIASGYLEFWRRAHELLRASDRIRDAKGGR